MAAHSGWNRFGRVRRYTFSSACRRRARLNLVDRRVGAHLRNLTDRSGLPDAKLERLRDDRTSNALDVKVGERTPARTNWSTQRVQRIIAVSRPRLLTSSLRNTLCRCFFTVSRL